jgi:NAD(P)H dehydrogenase (quinone)
MNRLNNVFIVFAHPEQRSFNGYLAQLARNTFAENGRAVTFSDLYALEFDPCESARHYRVRHDPRCFDAQAEQHFNWEAGLVPAQVKKEVDSIFWADLLVFQFPLWWFGLPAILKGWMDRVFVYGGLYSAFRRYERGVCQGKRALMCVTAGSPESACLHNGREGDTNLILWPSLFALHYVGFTVLKPFVIYGARGGLVGPAVKTQKQYLRNRAQEYKKYLLGIDHALIVPFNSDADWDESGKLKPDAPAYSPFIRHKRMLKLQ